MTQDTSPLGGDDPENNQAKLLTKKVNIVETTLLKPFKNFSLRRKEC